MTKRKWCVVAGLSAAAIWFASLAHAQVDPTRCRAPIASSDERIAGCTAVIEAGKGPKTNLAWAYDLRARAYFEIRDFDRAIADFSQLIELDPKDPHAHNNRGAAYFRKGDFDRAIADHDEAIRLDPKYKDAYVGRGATYMTKGEFDAAIAAYNEAIQLDPGDVRAYVARAGAFAAKAESERAIADYDRAIEINPRFAEAYLGRGSAYKVKGDTDHAIADFDELIRLDPKSARAYRVRGIVELQTGSLAKSLGDFIQSQQLDPKEPSTALWLEIVGKRSNLASRLTEATAQLDMTKLPAPVVRLFLSEATAKAVLAAADDPDPKTKKRQICEANFFAGELALQRGSTADARQLLGNVLSDCPKYFVAWSVANAELKALGVNP